MLKEIRKIKNKTRAGYIRVMMARNKITQHINEKGVICYDPEELKNYKKTAKRGRPPKILKREI